MGWLGGAGGCMQVRPLPSPWAGLQRARLERPREGGAGKESKEGEGCLQFPKRLCLGGARRSLKKSAWAGGDFGGGARGRRRPEGGAGAGRAATEGALEGRERIQGGVGSRPCAAPPLRARFVVREPLRPAGALLRDCSTRACSLAGAFPIRARPFAS